MGIVEVGRCFLVPFLSFSLYSLSTVVCILPVYFPAADGLFCFWFSIYPTFYL